MCHFLDSYCSLFFFFTCYVYLHFIWSLVDRYLLSTLCLVLILHFCRLPIIILVLAVDVCIIWAIMDQTIRVSSWRLELFVLPLLLLDCSLFLYFKNDFVYICAYFNFSCIRKSCTDFTRFWRYFYFLLGFFLCHDLIFVSWWHLQNPPVGKLLS